MSAPANSVFQTVVASEQFAIHYESRRTEDTKLMRMAVSESQSCSCSRTGSSNPSPSSGEMLWGGRRGWQFRRLHQSMECRDASAERFEQVPGGAGPR